VEYSILGPLQVIDAAGTGVEVAPGAGRTLLSALVLHAGHDVSADTLAEALWSGAEPPSWRKSLQMHVVRLRARIGRDRVETSPRGYRLIADDDAIDATRFVAGLRVLSPDRAHDLDGLLALWRGRPYDELGEWAPAVSERALLDALHADAVDAHTDARIKLGTATVTEVERLVNEAPEREHRWALLMFALYRAGRQAEALRAFDRARATLTADFGIEPGQALVALHRALLDQDPRLDAGDVTLAGFGLRNHDRADLRTSADSWIDVAEAARAAGNPARAVAAAEAAARSARLLGDPARLARAALVVAGDGWITGLDPEAPPLALLDEALEVLGAAPSPRRARLLARLAVAESHNRPFAIADRDSAAALALARVLGDAETTAIALHARLVVDQDIAHLAERATLAHELIALADAHDEPRWRAWAIPALARVFALRGDIDAALSALEDLAHQSRATQDPVGAYLAESRTVLAATRRGDYPAAELAAAGVREAGVRALMDPTAAGLAYYGTIGILRILQRVDVGASFTDDIVFPQATMHAAFRASMALQAAYAGNLTSAARALEPLTADHLAALPRDLYWPSLVWMLADVCRELHDSERAGALLALAAPFADVYVVDGGGIFLGSMHHHLGILASAAGDDERATAYLTAAVAAHERANAPTWVAISERELARATRSDLAERT
jgi:DNA-binding SARP family transcriptional activator